MIQILDEILTDSLPLLKQERIKSLSNYQLVREANILDYPIGGIPIYTPYGHKVFEKLRTLLRKKASKYGLTELLLSILQLQELFQKSNRYDVFKDDIYATHKKNTYILSPTSEEQIIDFLSRRIRSYRALPLYLYQIRQLFRNNSAHGITRNKEFIVFESYSFHSDKNSLIEAFTLYDDFFKEVLMELGITYFNNAKSEEKNYIDYLFLTQDGEYKFSNEVLNKLITNYDGRLTRASSLCMGMTVDQSIAKRLNFHINSHDSNLGDIYIGTFGFGFIRALSAIVEQQRDEKGIKLPSCLQPYSAIFIPEKHDSLDCYESLFTFFDERGDVIVDNRKCDRRYKINSAFFMGVSKVMYSKQDPLNGVKYFVLNRTGILNECNSIEQLNKLLDVSQ